MHPALRVMWGKTNRFDAGGVRVNGYRHHLLLWHLLDTAAVALELWDRQCSDHFQRSLAAALRLERGQARAWFGVLAALHDFGKATAHFQASSGFDHLTDAVDAVAPCRDTPHATHETLGALCLSDVLDDAGVTVPPRWLAAISVHKGHAPSAAEIDEQNANLSAQYGTASVWHEIRTNLMHVLREVVGATAAFTPGPLSQSLAAELAGRVKEADWIASTPAFFWLSGTWQDPHARWKLSQSVARKAVHGTSLRRWDLAVPEGFPEDVFSAMFATDRQPYEVQTLAADLAANLGDTGILVLEEQMGRGKTEAALWSASQFRRAAGIYIAMPTRATARVTRARMSAWLHNLGETMPPILNVSSAFDGGDDDQLEASEWFRWRHRGLLQSVGIGTVDQVLLAAENIPYGVVRLAGLGGRVVVFDEVHAYDTFMNELFYRALSWLASMGCPVVVLTATLPSSSRQRIVDSYRAGLAPNVAPVQVIPSPYPRITAANLDGIHCVSLEPAPEHTVTVEHVNDHDDTGMIEAFSRVKNLVRQDNRGCIGVVCNSTGSAIDAYELARKAFPDADVVLLHSRYTPADREALENRVLELAGKCPDAQFAATGHRGTHARRDRLVIVVGTQIIEQSLDLDFDLMVSEFAPVDLLLQRSGRLFRWRADTHRPAWADQPRLLIIDPQPEGRDRFSRSYVYWTSNPMALVCSWQIMRGRTSLTLPTEIDPLVEAVYDHMGHTVNDIDDDLADLWERAHARDTALRAEATTQARTLLLPNPWNEHGYSERVQHPISRYGTDTATVVAVHQLDNGQYAPVGSATPTPFDDVHAYASATVTVPYYLIGTRIPASPRPHDWERTRLHDANFVLVNVVGGPTYDPTFGLQYAPQIVE